MSPLSRKSSSRTAGSMDGADAEKRQGSSSATPGHEPPHELMSASRHKRDHKTALKALIGAGVIVTLAVWWSACFLVRRPLPCTCSRERRVLT